MNKKGFLLLVMALLASVVLSAQESILATPQFFKQLDRELDSQHYATVYTQAKQLYGSLQQLGDPLDSAASRQLMMASIYMVRASLEYKEDVYDSVRTLAKAIDKRLRPIDRALYYLLINDYDNALRDTAYLKGVPIDTTLPFFKRIDVTRTYYEFALERVVYEWHTSYEEQLKLSQALVAYCRSLPPSSDRDMRLLYHESMMTRIIEDTERLSRARTILNQYRHLDCEMVAALYLDVARLMKEEYGERRADSVLALLDTVQMRFPNSSYSIQECCALRAEINDKNIYLETPDKIVARRDFLVYLNSRNVDTLYFRIIPGDEEYRSHPAEELLALKPVAEWSQCPYDVARFKGSTSVNKHMTIGSYAYCPGLEAGDYILLASPTRDMKEYGYQVQSFTVHSAYFHQVLNSKPGSLAGYMIDFTTGEPIKGLKVGLYDQETDRLWATAKTNASGYISFDGVGSPESASYFTLRFKYQGVKNELDVSLGRSNSNPESKQSVLITDRPVYKPGDTLHYLCVLGKTLHNRIGMVRSEESCWVEFVAPNEKVLYKQKLSTDSLGAIQGMVVLPSDMLPGGCTIRVTDYFNKKAICSSSIIVESYKQSKFEVTLSPGQRHDSQGNIITPVMGDSLVVEGLAASYNQVPISNARVIYTVHRSSVNPWWRRYGSYSYHYYYQSTSLVNDTILTDAEGRFRIAFVAQPGDKGDSLFSYQVTARVTDVSGETHDKSTTLFMGYDNALIDIPLADRTRSLDKLTFRYCDLNGNPLQGRLALKVERLKVPDPYLFETDSMRHSLSPDDFARRYPSYSYGESVSRWHWPVERLVYTDTVEANGQPNYSIPMPQLQAGMYRISMQCGTTENHVIVHYVPPTSRSLSVNDLLWIDIDKDRAYIGDTLRLRIGSRHRGLHVIMGIWGDKGVLEHRVVDIDNQVLSLPIVITEAMLGGIRIEFSCVKEGLAEVVGRDVVVPFEHKKLDVTYESFRDKLVPGEQETWKIRITPCLSQPRQLPARLALTMFDAALNDYVSHAKNYYWHPWTAFYVRRGFAGKCRPEVHWRLDRIKPQDSCATDLPEPFSGLWFSPKWEMPIFVMGDVDAPVIDDICIVSERNPFIEVGDACSGQRMSADDAVYSIVESDDLGEFYDDYGELVGEPETYSKDAIPDEKPVSAPVPQGRDLRTNLSTLAFFEPGLTTDSLGALEYTFTVPDLLTQWQIKGLAWNGQLATGSIERTLVTQKPLMIQPMLPRFLRQGDNATLMAKVSNLSDTAIRADVEFAFEINSTTQQKTTQQINIPAHSTVAVSFPVHIDQGGTVATYTFRVSGGNYRDGERGPLPLLTNRQAVTQSMTLYTSGAQRKSYSMPISTSATAQPVGLTVEYTANPVWLALQSLPYMSDQAEPSNLYLFNSYYTNTLGLQLANRYPHLCHLADSAAENDSPLFRNSEVRQTLLEETPWLSDGKSEVERLQRLANYYQPQQLQSQCADALKLLLESQQPDGGWAWMPGRDNSSQYVTQYIVKGFGQMRQQLGIDSLPQLAKAMRYLDDQAVSSYTTIKEQAAQKPRIVSEPINLDYLYTRSYYPGLTLSKEGQEAYDYFYTNASKYYGRYTSLHSQALLALVFHRHGDTKLAAEMVRRIKEKALYSDEMGMYWRDNAAGCFFYQRPVETQALLIETFREVTPADTLSVSRMQQWLLKQKQTTTWDNSIATLQAILALMSQGGDADRAAQSSSKAMVVVADDTLRSTGPDYGYLRHTYRDTALQQIVQSKTLRLQVQNDRTSWGAVYYQYTEQMDKVAASQNGIIISRRLYRVDSDGKLAKIEPGTTQLRVGDRVRVCMDVKCDRNLEYVEVKHPRAACFEPVSTSSGWCWTSGLRYYCAVNNTHDALYADRLNKGKYTVECNYYVTHSGTFTLAPTVLQCLYAPEFRATSAGSTVTVLP